eukprot:2047729-Rhodomonas_salina.3
MKPSVLFLKLRSVAFHFTVPGRGTTSKLSSSPHLTFRQRVEGAHFGHAFPGKEFLGTYLDSDRHTLFLPYPGTTAR